MRLFKNNNPDKRSPRIHAVWSEEES
jgi:hypothetical protein